jgi:hypothetical protein
VSTIFALLTWSIVVKNFLIVCCHADKLNTDAATRDKRRAMAENVALGWNIANPCIAWAIQQSTGFKHIAVAPALYHKMVGSGVMVLLILKVLNLLMSTLTAAEDSLNASGDAAWQLASKDTAAKTQGVKKCAGDIVVHSSVVTFGPLWFQKLFRGIVLTGVFVERPCGVGLGILGIIDTKIMGKITVKLLSVIPSWIQQEINMLENKLKEISAEAENKAEMLEKELVDHLAKIQHVFANARRFLEETVEDLQEVHDVMLKHKHRFGDSLCSLLAGVVANVESALASFVKDVDFAEAEMAKVADQLEKKEMKVVEDAFTSLTALLDSIRPENIMLRLEHLADEGLYGEMIKTMALLKSRGATHLGKPSEE